MIRNGSDNKTILSQDNDTSGATAGGTGAFGLWKGLLFAGAALGAAAIANAYIAYSTPPLLSTLPGGELRYHATPHGDLFYKKAGDGPPLLLLHGIGAGCSSFEFRNVFGPLSEQYTVYAMDLLGFGKSDKPGLFYDAELFIETIARFCREVIGVGDGRGEADVIATSLSAAYVIALSQRDESIFRRLVLVCPTGYEELSEKPSAASVVVRGALQTPILGESVYNGITSRAGVRTYLKENIYADTSKVTEEVVDQYHRAAHQAGGSKVLPYFLSGYMNISVGEAFKGIVDLPLLVWGRQAKESPLEQSEPFLLANPNAKLEVIEEAGMLPHEEQPEAFLSAVRPFLSGADSVDPAADEEMTYTGTAGSL